MSAIGLAVHLFGAFYGKIMVTRGRIGYGKSHGIADLSANAASGVADTVLTASRLLINSVARRGKRMLTAGGIGNLVGVLRVGTDLAANGTRTIARFVSGAISFQTNNVRLFRKIMSGSRHNGAGRYDLAAIETNFVAGKTVFFASCRRIALYFRMLVLT